MNWEFLLTCAVICMIATWVLLGVIGFAYLVRRTLKSLMEHQQ